MNAFLATLSPMRAAKAEAALNMMVRHNGARILVSRASIVESKVSAGAKVTLRKNGERVLMDADGCFLDVRNITATGLDYASFLAEGFPHRLEQVTL